MPQQEPKQDKKPGIKSKPGIGGILKGIVEKGTVAPKVTPKAPAKPEALPEKKTPPAKVVTKVVTKPTPKKSAVKEEPKKAEAPSSEGEDYGFGGKEYVERNYKRVTNDSTSKGDDDVYFRSGLYKRKGGDVFPTDKYNELKNNGKLKAYIKEFNRRDSIADKVNTERSKKVTYNLADKRNAEMIKKDVVNSLKNFK